MVVLLGALIPLLGRGKLGAGAIWNGKIRHNRSVPNYAVVFEGPKPFFEVSLFFSSLAMHISIVPNSILEKRVTAQAAIQRL